MKKLPDRFVLPISPKEYLQQGLSHCGVYSVKAVLSAMGLDRGLEPKNYHPHWLGKVTGMTFGREYYPEILARFGVEAVAKNADTHVGGERINILKGLLNKGFPVMIRIGNGFSTNRYNPFLGRLQPHWITLWGYDSRKGVFYVYDSGLPKRFWNLALPAGNTTRTFAEILRDWSFGKWQIWIWPFTGRRNFLYVEVTGRLV